jgi:hypothetical protein
VSQNDVEEIRVLIKNFATAKEELHNLNAQKMNSLRAEGTLHITNDHAEGGTKKRGYSSEVGRKVGEKALENCREISSIVYTVDPAISGELDKAIRMAARKLDNAGDSSAKGSADDLYFWCKEELLPLLNKSEQIGQLCLKQISSGNEEPKI